MAEPNGAVSGRELSPAVVGLAMLEAGTQAGVGTCLQLGVPASDVMNLLIEHVMRVLSLVEPEQARNAVLGEIRKNLPGVLNRHLEARMRTPGGVLLPEGAMRQ